MLLSPEEIRKQVEAGFVTGGINLSNVSQIQEKAKLLVKRGIELDADAICHIFSSGDNNNKLSVLLVVGRSMLMGPEAYKWLLDYHNNNPAAAKRGIDKIADYAVTGLSTPAAEECTLPITDAKNKAWRAFKVQQPGGTVKSVDDIRKSAYLKLGR